METANHAWCGLSGAEAERSVAELPDALVERAGEIVDGATAAIVVGDPEAGWHLASASGDGARALTTLQLETGEGPCVDCLVRASPTLVPELSSPPRWLGLARLARARGVRATLSVPLSGGRAVLGALCVYAAEPPALEGRAHQLAALAELTGVALVQRRASAETKGRVGALERALAARIPVEQAKGIVAEHAHVDVSAAFGYLVRCARARGWPLEELAEVVTSGSIDLEEVVGHRRPGRGRTSWRGAPLEAVHVASR